MIASHYAEPVRRVIAAPAPLRSGPSEQSETLREVAGGEPFLMLDETIGWAWGYAGLERRVGYLRSETLTRP